MTPVNVVVRLAVTLIILIATSFSGRAENLYFVYLAEIQEQNRPLYNDFLRKVSPIWKRHSMTLLARGNIVAQYGETKTGFAPTEFGLLRVEKRSNFSNYLKDPNYQAIKVHRVDAVDSFVVLEGSKATVDGIDFLKKTPLVAMALHQGTSLGENFHFRQNTEFAAPVKGVVGKFLKQVSTIELTALSFDDNPAALLSNKRKKSLLLIGENLLIDDRQEN